MDFPSLLPLLLEYKYWILLPVAMVEGPVVALVAGFLVSIGVMEFLPTYLLLLLGDAVPDIGCYCIGRYGGGLNFVNRHIHRIGLTKHRQDMIVHWWQNHTFKSLFLSKWADGLSMPLLVLAGFAKTPFRKYMLFAIIIAAFDYLLFLVVGYYAGESYRRIAEYVEYAGTLFVLFGIALVALYVIVTKMIRKFIATGREPPSLAE